MTCFSFFFLKRHCVMMRKTRHMGFTELISFKDLLQVDKDCTRSTKTKQNVKMMVVLSRLLHMLFKQKILFSWSSTSRYHFNLTVVAPRLNSFGSCCLIQTPLSDTYAGCGPLKTSSFFRRPLLRRSDPLQAKPNVLTLQLIRIFNPRCSK